MEAIRVLYRGYMGCSQNYGPLLVIDYITAPISSGYQRRYIGVLYGFYRVLYHHYSHHDRFFLLL